MALHTKYSHIELEFQPQLKIKNLITCKTLRPWSQSSLRRLLA